MADQPSLSPIVINFDRHKHLWVTYLPEGSILGGDYEYNSFEDLGDALDSVASWNSGYAPEQPFQVRHRYFDRQREIDEFYEF